MQPSLQMFQSEGVSAISTLAGRTDWVIGHPCSQPLGLYRSPPSPTAHTSFHPLSAVAGVTAVTLRLPLEYRTARPI